MAVTVIVHVMGEDPFLAELEDLPEPTHQSVILANPRRRDNKPLYYLERETISVIFPLHRINFIEIMPSERISTPAGGLPRSCGALGRLRTWSRMTLSACGAPWRRAMVPSGCEMRSSAFVPCLGTPTTSG